MGCNREVRFRMSGLAHGIGSPAVFFLALVVALCALWSAASAEDIGKQKAGEKGKSVTSRNNIDISGKTEAPPLDGGKGWLNVDRPLSLEELRGKVVLLDFWTFCCINCMHVIPDLKKLEKKYPKELAVIGVHSAKFLNEKETENIRSAILRYEIEHPVVNDADFVIWRRYGVRAWPTIAIIDPEGQLVGTVSGEGHYDLLDQIIALLIEKFKDTLNTDPLPLALEKDKAPPTVLSFPGKVLADEKSGRLFVADSNKNRIIVADLEGHVLAVAGKGSSGFTDGAFAEAEFNRPQGIVLDGNYLYVADTENHALRRLDLIERTVETAAGTGQQSRSRRGGSARETALNSPWDVERIGDGEEVYIANAGSHQLWVYRPEAERVEPFVGTGREDIIDGAPDRCALAQPSGLTTDGINLYFADSEVSALRTVDLTGKSPTVKTLIGTGLFDFGDQDGGWETALLQHPLGVAYADGKVYIADSYNHKIKVADLAAQTISTLVGTGVPGLGTKDAPQLNEPGGLSIAGSKLYIADTNNHAVRVVDLETRKVTTLLLDFSAIEASEEVVPFEVAADSPRIDLRGQRLSPGGEVQLTFEFPEGYHLNPLAEPAVQFRVTSRNGDQWVGKPFVPDASEDTITFDVNKRTVDDPETIEVALSFYYCGTDNEGLCYMGNAFIQSVLGSGTGTVKLRHPVCIP